MSIILYNLYGVDVIMYHSNYLVPGNPVRAFDHQMEKVELPSQGSRYSQNFEFTFKTFKDIENQEGDKCISRSDSEEFDLAGKLIFVH